MEDPCGETLWDFLCFVLVRVGAHMGLMGPYGPIWTHMAPYETSWTGLGRLRKLSVRLLDKFRTFRVKKLYFDEIYR